MKSEKITIALALRLFTQGLCYKLRAWCFDYSFSLFKVK